MKSLRTNHVLNPSPDVSLGETSEYDYAPQEYQDSQDIKDSEDHQDLDDQQKNPIERPNGPLEDEAVLRLPLGKYLELAIEEQTTWMDDASWDNWRSPMFQFARFCKAHPDLSDLSDHEAMRKVEKAMRKFDDLPRGANPWEFYFPYADADDPDSARLDFMASWVSIRHVPFSDVLSNAMRLAKGEPLRPKCDRGELYARFVSFAAWLQFLMGDSDIWLPTRKFAEFLSCDQRTVSRLRKLAIRDGLLTIVKPHCFRSSGRSEATSFRFAIERFPDLCERQERYLRFPPRNM